MARAYWKQVLDRGLEVPTDRPLDDLTAELTSMLGSPQPEERDVIAYPALATWVDRGVYDDLLVGLGDGMAAGLTVGLGERGTDTVFRRTFSVLVLASVVERDTAAHLLPADQVLRWGDRIVTWLLRERDLRGYVPGKGWAHAVGHGADAVAGLAASRHFGATELTVLLDVLADRVLDADEQLLSGEPDQVASAVMAVLRRDLVPLEVVEPWVARLVARGSPYGSRPEGPEGPEGPDHDPYLRTNNVQQLLRSLYLQLAIAPHPPAEKADLVLALVDALRRTNPFTLAR